MLKVRRFLETARLFKLSVLRRSDTGRFLTGRTAYVASQMVMAVALARIGGVDEFAGYVWATALAAPGFLLAHMSLDRLQMADVDYRFHFLDYLTHRLASIFIAGSGVAVTGYVIVSDDNYLSVFAAVCAFKSFELLVDLVYGEAGRQSDLSHVGKSLMARSLLGTTGFVLALWLTKSAAAGVGILALITCFFGVFELRRAHRLYIARQVGSPSLKNVLRHSVSLGRLALPVGVSFFVGSLTVNWPKYVIERSSGAAELALFGGLAYFVVMANTVADALTHSAIPQLSRAWRSGNRLHFTGKLRSLSVRLVALAGVALGGSLLFGNFLAKLALGLDNNNANIVLSFLCVAAGFQYVAAVFRTGLIACDRLRAPLGVSLLNFSVVAISSVPLVGAFGALGAALSVGLGQAFALLVYTLLVGRFIRAWRSV